MNAIELISQDLFDKVRSRYSNLEMGDEDGNTTSDPRTARFFDFDYTIEGTNLGRVSISINERGALKIFYSQGILEDASPITQNLWFDFLKEMRNFAKRRLLRFDTRDITKSNLDKTDFKYLASVGTKEDNMSESKMFGSSKSSYLPIEKTRLIVRHNKAVDEEQRGSRSRGTNINSIYIENADGERFKYPYIHLAGAKAMQRHVANGGRPYDECGNAIVKMSEQIAQLSAFKRHVGRHDSMHADANDITDRACLKLETLRAHINNLSKQGHYHSWKEAFAPSGSDDQMVLDQATMEDYKSKFTVSSFAEDLSQYFPLIDSIMREAGTVDLEDVVGEGADNDICPECKEDPCVCNTTKTVKEFAQFESWAAAIAEGTISPDIITSLKELLANDKFTLGVDGTSAIEAIEGVGIHDPELNAALEKLAAIDPTADPIPTISAWINIADPAAAQALGLSPQPTTDAEPAIPASEDIEGAYEEQPAPSLSDIAEMVKSFYDAETGNFPLGETGVITKVKKELGDEAGRLAERLVSHLASQQGNAHATEVEEAGVWDVVGKRAGAHGGHQPGELDDTQKRVLNKMGFGSDEPAASSVPTIRDKHGRMVPDPFAAAKLARTSGRVNPAEESIDTTDLDELRMSPEEAELGDRIMRLNTMYAKAKVMHDDLLAQKIKGLLAKLAAKKAALSSGNLEEPTPIKMRAPVAAPTAMPDPFAANKAARYAGRVNPAEEGIEEGMPLDGHPYHSKSDNELKYIIKDAGQAAMAMKGHSPKAEEKYLDQVNDASTVLYYRRMQNTPAVSENYAGRFKNSFSVSDRVDTPLGHGTIVAVAKDVDSSGKVKVKLDDPSKAGEDGNTNNTFVLNTNMLTHLTENNDAFSENYAGHFNDDDWYEVDPSTNKVLKHAGGSSQHISPGIGHNIKLPNGNILMKGMRAKYLTPVRETNIAENNLRELSTDKLGQYKKAASVSATAADTAGDTKLANKRFSGIVKATKKQFSNDATAVEKNKVQESIDNTVFNDIMKLAGLRKLNG